MQCRLETKWNSIQSAIEKLVKLTQSVLYLLQFDKSWKWNAFNAGRKRKLWLKSAETCLEKLVKLFQVNLFSAEFVHYLEPLCLLWFDKFWKKRHSRLAGNGCFCLKSAKICLEKLVKSLQVNLFLAEVFHRKRKLCLKSAETCLEKLVKSLQVNLIFGC